MRFFFMSDLHICSAEDTNAKNLELFLKNELQSGDILVLGGDVFDLFVGGKSYFLRKFSSILNAMAEASDRGACIYYLEGNHDFLLDEVFYDQERVFHETDDFELIFDERKIFISHGDLINRRDYGYRFLRFVFRSTPFRRLVSLLPGFLIGLIGKQSSEVSRRYTAVEEDSEHSGFVIDLYRKFAQKKIEQGYKFVFIGHSHLKDNYNYKDGQYINLGFSSKKLLFAELNEETDTVILSAYPA